jgi:hypothetical protein
MRNRMSYDEWARTSAEDRLKETDFLVEANSFEHLCLWREWHEYLSWEQCNPGAWLTIGKVNDRPVCINMFWDLINGKLVCFYDACSQIVDFEQVEDWFEKNYKGRWDSNTRRASCDSMNFHLCLDHITDGKIPIRRKQND